MTVDIPDGAAEDDAGNESEAASRFSIAAELDTTAPTVTISTAASRPRSTARSRSPSPSRKR